MKKVRTPDYNYDFNPETGLFVRWGKTPDDDPKWSPLGAEIADIEISTICHGINGVPCAYCYKSNVGKGHNMSLNTFKKIFKNLPTNITQIAFGIGDIDSNPDMLDIFRYCRENGVIPNVTINGDRLSKYMVESLVEVCGAVAVSNHGNKDICYGAVKALTDAGLKQVNIHQVLCKETLDECYEVISDVETDPRLANLNALVFLSIKTIGRGRLMHKVSEEEFASVVELAMEFRIPFGFDSCSCNKFLRVTAHKHPELAIFAEPCESTLFSIYINVFGYVYPCSFAEEGNMWLGDATKTPLNTIWKSRKCNDFRKMLERSCRSCPIHDV